MFSHNKILTLSLVVLTLALSYQTYTLASLSGKLSAAQINFGASSAVNLTSDGGVPSMVGGC